MTDPHPPPAPGAPVDLTELRAAYAAVVAQIQAHPDPLVGFRCAVRALKELEDLADEMRGVRNQQAVLTRDARSLSLAGLADLFSTDAGLEVGRHRVNQMIQAAAAAATQEGNPAA